MIPSIGIGEDKFETQGRSTPLKLLEKNVNSAEAKVGEVGVVVINEGLPQLSDSAIPLNKHQISIELAFDSEELKRAFGKGEEEFFTYIAARQDMFADHLLISKVMLVSKKLDGEEKYRAYVQKKMEKYGPGGQFESAMCEARHHFQNRVPEGESGNLSDYSVMKAYRHAMRTLKAHLNPEGGVMFSFADPEKSEKREYYLAGVDGSRKLHLYNWSGKIVLDEEDDEEFLGSGFLGVVQKIYDLAHSRFGAFKVAESSEKEYQELAETHIIQEGQKLLKVHKNGLCKGVMEPPWFFINLTGKVEECERKILGSIGPFYNQRDVEQLMRQHIGGYAGRSPILRKAGPDDGQLREMVYQIYEGLHAIHSAGIIHGDIKAGNCFLDEKKPQEWNLYIGDFGGTMDIKEFISLMRDPKNSQDMTRIFGTIFSFQYFTKGDRIQIERAKSIGDEQTLWKLQILRDIYGATVTVWELISKMHPYDHDKDNYPIITRYGPDCVSCSRVQRVLGKRKTDILKQALLYDPVKRPTLEKIRSVLAEP